MVQKNSDEVEDGIAKNSDEMLSSTNKALKPSTLMDELVNSGVKYNPDDVVMVAKTPKGNLMWLENGNSSSGLKHIVERHAADFSKRGINDITEFLIRILGETPVKNGITHAGPFADYLVDNKMYRVCFGTNGYIVTFYPIDL